MTRTVALVQARMGSTRFAGKMLAELGGTSILEWVLKRVRRAHLIDEVVLATSNLKRDDALADLATRLSVSVFRGSEADVLARFADAANSFTAETVVRVCADNPFVDPDELDRLVAFFSDADCDYACNHLDRLGSRYADGFGAEILSNQLLQKIAAIASEAKHREHATLYLWDHASEFRLMAVPAPAPLAFPSYRFDVDSLSDLDVLQRMVAAGVNIEMPAAKILDIARRQVNGDNPNGSNDPTAELDHYLRRLFPLCRSITGEPNRETLRVLQEVIPLTICEIPSGTAVYDWLIPDEWTIRDAWVADSSGRRLVDFRQNNLHLVSYSVPINTTLTWEELAPHVHRHPDLPKAIPYRTSYYQRDWGFCVTHAQYEELAEAKGPFSVVVDADLKPGSMSYGEYLIPGRSKKEILLSCYLCHPSMSNDSLSGVLLTAFLARRIAALPDRHWSYRVVFVPETIGAIVYCAHNETAMRDIDMGLVITTVGGPGPFGYKQSFQAEHPINTFIEKVLNETGQPYKKYPFDIHGSDERQYSSQGFRINAATLCRDRYYEYPYYHSSLDDLSFVTAGQIAETLALYERLIEKLEARQVYRNRIPCGEVMLSKHDLYPKTGGAQLPELGGRSELDLILWLLFMCDGRIDTEQLAAKLEVTEEMLSPIISRLVAKDILEAV